MAVPAPRGRLGNGMTLRMLTARTTEVDDVDAAVEDILGQLHLEKNLLRQAAGLLFCNYAFVDSGLVSALCARLPFEVIGCTTQGVVTPRGMGGLMLGLAVLTSDEAGFATGLSEPLLHDEKGRLTDLYRRTSARLGAPPALIFACQPMLGNLAGMTVVNALDDASGGVPLFGTVAHDASLKKNLPATIRNGSASRDRLALLLVAGDIDARFFVEWFPVKKVISETALITKAEDSAIVEINNLPALDYMDRLGAIAEGKEALHLMPLVITSPDGRRKTVACIGFAGKSLVCGDIIPPGGTMNFGAASDADVLESAGRIARAVKQGVHPDGAGLIFSCCGRSSALADPLAEMALMHQCLRDAGPYLLMYSGGELCPWRSRGDNVQRNRFYQFAIVACVLRPRRT